MVYQKNEPEKWQSLAAPSVLMETVVGRICSERFRCLRTGAEGDFISFDLKNWVVVLAETPDGKLLVVRQFRHGARTMQWEIPGGCIDAGETDPAQAGIRELLEETGYAGEDARVIGDICPNPALQSNRCYTVLVRNVRKVSAPALEDTEDIETFAMTPGEILGMIRRGEFEHGIMLDSILFYLLEKEMI